MTKRLTAYSVLVILVVGLGACSSSAKESSPTNGPTTTSAVVPRIKGKLGPCPAIYPRVQLKTLNEGLPALDQQLVPLDVTSARVCTYNGKGRLTASGTLSGEAAVTFATDTNALTKSPGPINCPNQQINRLFFLTFDSTKERVHVGESDACGGGVSNGTLVAKEAKPWAAEVLEAATKKVPAK